MRELVGQRTQILIAGGNQLFVIAPQQRKRSLFWRSFWWGFFSVIMFFTLVVMFA